MIYFFQFNLTMAQAYTNIRLLSSLKIIINQALISKYSAPGYFAEIPLSGMA